MSIPELCLLVTATGGALPRAFKMVNAMLAVPPGGALAAPALALAFPLAKVIGEGSMSKYGLLSTSVCCEIESSTNDSDTTNVPFLTASRTLQHQKG